MALSDKQRERFLGLQTGHVSDAMAGMELYSSVLHGMRYLGTPGGRMVGTAYTVRQAPKHVTSPRQKGMVSHAKVSGELASEGEVIVVDAGGRTDTGTWGENHCMRAKPRGVAGAVINGATRDGYELTRVGFPVFCMGVSPVKSQWDLETVGHNEPVVIAGVQVRPGDILFGDETGIILVPPELADKVLDAAQKIHDQEADYAKQFE
jgi:4-hydroxy-4-methyl-2-oxoglutarate aldolase